MIKNSPGYRLYRCVFKTGLFVIVAAAFLSSCRIYKPSVYFKDITRDTTISGFVNPETELRIQKDDVLGIGISSLNSLEDALFNPKEVSSTGYIVGLDGSIYLHRLGKVAVVGITRKQLITRLENDLVPFLKDPIVSVIFLNHKITFLGESGSQVLTMPEEKMSLIDVLAKSSSGITPNTKLNNVLVIREIPGAKQFKHLNLEDPSIFTSPWYYLQPNDIVVVKPNEEKLDDEQKRIKRQQLFTTALSAVSFSLIILDRIFRK